MVETLSGLPAGVLGFKGSGKITRDEYREMMDPIYNALEHGGPVNLLFVVGDDFSGLDGGALWEDLKAGGSVGLKHRSVWRRMAVATDKNWIRHAIAAAGWLAPGELRIFEPAEQAEATASLAAAA
jgi:stage II sporulation SpoAA-like protein